MSKSHLFQKIADLTTLTTIIVILGIIYLQKGYELWFWKNHPSTQWKKKDVLIQEHTEITPSLLQQFHTDKPDLVIAYYNEDLSWVSNLAPLVGHITIYNKDSTKTWPKNLETLPQEKLSLHYLPNVGRDNHSFLTHIIQNYDHMPARTVFTVGNPTLPARYSTLLHRILNIPFCWKQYPKEKISQYSFYGTPFFHMVPHNNKKLASWSPITRSPFTPFSAWAEHYLNATEENLSQADICLWDGMFSVQGTEVTAYPITLYQKLRNSISHASTTEDGYFISFTWQMLFPQKHFSDHPSPAVLKHLKKQNQKPNESHPSADLGQPSPKEAPAKS